MPRGFTLVEILLVFALVGIAIALTLMSFSTFDADWESEPPEKLLIRAVKSARLAAIKQRDWTYLRYDATEQAFIIENKSGSSLDVVALDRPISADRDNLQIIFQMRAAETIGSFPVRLDFGETVFNRIAFSPQRVTAPISARILAGDIDLTIEIAAFSALPKEPLPN